MTADVLIDAFDGEGGVVANVKGLSYFRECSSVLWMVYSPKVYWKMYD
jgi:hypothetical protein